MSDEEYLKQIGMALDVYSSYDKYLLTGDFNIEETDACLSDFLFEHNAKNLVKDPTCFKSVHNPSCIDLFLTNNYRNFQNTITVSTGLSDCHKMIMTVMKTRDYKTFVENNFLNDLNGRLR